MSRLLNTVYPANSALGESLLGLITRFQSMAMMLRARLGIGRFADEADETILIPHLLVKYSRFVTWPFIRE